MLPIIDMKRRGWLRATKIANDLQRDTHHLLGGDPETMITTVSLRHSVARGPERGAQIAWVSRVRQTRKPSGGTSLQPRNPHEGHSDHSTTRVNSSAGG